MVGVARRDENQHLKRSPRLAAFVFTHTPVSFPKFVVIRVTPSRALDSATIVLLLLQSEFLLTSICN